MKNLNSCRPQTHGSFQALCPPPTPPHTLPFAVSPAAACPVRDCYRAVATIHLQSIARHDDQGSPASVLLRLAGSSGTGGSCSLGTGGWGSKPGGVAPWRARAEFKPLSAAPRAALRCRGTKPAEPTCAGGLMRGEPGRGVADGDRGERWFSSRSACRAGGGVEHGLGGVQRRSCKLVTSQEGSAALPCRDGKTVGLWQHSVAEQAQAFGHGCSAPARAAGPPAQHRPQRSPWRRAACLQAAHSCVGQAGWAH